MKAPFTHANPKVGKAPKHTNIFNNQSHFGTKKQQSPRAKTEAH